MISILLSLMAFGFATSSPSAVMLPSVDVRLLSGGNVVLDRIAGKNATVIVTREAGCPISELYGTRLKNLESRFSKDGVEFIYLYVGQIDIAKSAASDLQKFGFAGPYVVDFNLLIASQLKVETTTEVLVFDKQRKLVYKGAIDNQYSLVGNKPKPTENHLEEKLTAVLRNTSETFSSTQAPGCQVNYPTARGKTIGDLTFNDDIFPIFENKCLSCHHEGQNYDLSSYELAKGHAKMIRYVLEKNIMPPWTMKAGLGPWIGDHSLLDSEKRAILNWTSSNMKEGSGKKISSFKWSKTWTMGEPDVVVKLPTKVKVPADGAMEYKHFIIDNPFKKTVWVKMFEILTQPNVVHHATLHVLKDNSITDPKLFYGNDITRFQWAVGSVATHFPPDVGARIPANSKIAITVHYNPNGKEVIDDTTQFGFKLHSFEPAFEREKLDLEELNINIPAGVADHVIKLNHVIPKDSYLLSVNAHMHLRGKSAKITARFPNGKKQVLLDVDPYRFKYQLVYSYKEPRVLPKGTLIECENHFDNSKDNVVNPDSTKNVSWGEQTFEEMSICNLDMFSKR